MKAEYDKPTQQKNEPFARFECGVGEKFLTAEGASEPYQLSLRSEQGGLRVSRGYIRLMSDLLSLENHGDSSWAQEMHTQLGTIANNDERLAELAKAVDERLNHLSDQYRTAMRIRYDLDNPESESVKSYAHVGSQLKRQSDVGIGVSKARALQLIGVAQSRLRWSANRRPIFGFVPYGFLSRSRNLSSSLDIACISRENFSVSSKIWISIELSSRMPKA